MVQESLKARAVNVDAWALMSELLNSWFYRVQAWVLAEDGQGLTEYALVVALVILVSVVALTTLGHHVTSAITTVARAA